MALPVSLGRGQPWELTEKLDLGLQYNATVGLGEDLGTEHHALATLSFDVWKNL